MHRLGRLTHLPQPCMRFTRLMQVGNQHRIDAAAQYPTHARLNLRDTRTHRVHRCAIMVQNKTLMRCIHIQQRVAIGKAHMSQPCDRAADCNHMPLPRTRTNVIASQEQFQNRLPVMLQRRKRWSPPCFFHLQHAGWKSLGSLHFYEAQSGTRPLRRAHRDDRAWGEMLFSRATSAPSGRRSASHYSVNESVFTPLERSCSHMLRQIAWLVHMRNAARQCW